MSDLKETPVNNKDEAKENQPERPVIFTITAQALSEHIQTVEEVLASRVVKEVLYNSLNSVLVPLIEKEK